MKLKKVMQRCIYLYALVFSFVFAFANGQNTNPNTKVNINLDDVTLVEIFKVLSEKTDFEFSYGEYVLKNKSNYSINQKNKTLKVTLDDLAIKAGFDYRIEGRIITIKSKSQNLSGFGSIYPVENQDFEINGTVIDETGVPLPGVSIVEKGTNNGAATDFDGHFSLTVSSSNSTLVLSYIGYKTMEMPVGGKSDLNIQMEPDASLLDEVVVVGYGTTTKEKFNGAVSKVKTEKLNNFSSANFEQALSGNIAGVQVVGNGKNPGENSVIQIRGLSTLTAGTNPLIVVDGNPLSEGSSFSSINTQDIESVSVLKDAASASIYGSRASNGVILITTKKGKQGKLQVTYDTYYGFQNRIDKFELVDAYEYALFDNDARNFGYLSGGPGRTISDNNAIRDANGGGKRSRLQPFLQDYINGSSGLTNSNWLDAVFRTASQQNHYLNLAGGSEKTSYSISFGYLDQENIVIGSDYKRYTNNIRLNTDISDKIRFGVSSNISLTNSHPTGERAWSGHSARAGEQPDPSYAVVLMQPYYPIYNSDGSFALGNQLDDNNDNWDGPIDDNTVAKVAMTDYFERSLRIFGNTFLEIDIWDELSFKTSFGGDFNTTFSEFFSPSNIGNYRTPIANSLAEAFENNYRRENYITENLLTYDKNYDKHSFDFLLGFSFQEENIYNTRLESNNFVDDNLRNISGATNPSSLVSRSKWSLVSYFSRLQYDFDRKYSLSASLRRDGSSRFGKNAKYANFASFSGGWTVSNEEFFPADGLVNFMKLRASWGQTGNNQIGDFASVALVEPENYTIDGELISGSYVATSPNPDLSWETNTALNLGMDFGFFNNKLSLTAEYYNTRTTDLLLEVPVPQQSGYSQSLQNIGEMENKGFELELSGSNFELGAFTLGFNANITTNSNEVLALGEGQEQIISNSGGMDFLTKVGGSIAEFYAYDIIGVYKTQEQIDSESFTPLPGTEIGDYVVRDANNDGRITPDDRVVLGDYNPELTYGFGLNVGYKNFDLSLQFTGVEGRLATDNMLYDAESGEGFFVPTKYYFDNYFNDRNPNGFLRRPDFSSFSSAGRATRASSLSAYDADYFRLRSLQLGYNFPEQITNALKVDQFRLYFTGNNIFNITKYRGYNPDGIDSRSNRTQTLTRGWVNSTSPVTRFLALGLNVKF